MTASNTTKYERTVTKSTLFTSQQVAIEQGCGDWHNYNGYQDYYNNDYGHFVYLLSIKRKCPPKVGKTLGGLKKGGEQ